MTKSLNWGLRIISLLLCLACLLPSVLPVTATEAEETGFSLTTVVRNRAYYSATVIGQMEDGTELTVLSETRDFYKVDCYDMTGYIAKTQVIHTEDGKCYVNCIADSSETRSQTYTDYAKALELRHSLLALAKNQLGKPYIYGSIGTRGFDCSGLMYYLYNQHGIELHRTASQQLQDGIIVAKEGLQVGDLIFFRENWESYPASHVGIYVGNNQIIHASSTHGIVYADLDFDYFYKYYLCARRVINTDIAQIEDISAANVADRVRSVSSISGRTAP